MFIFFKEANKGFSLIEVITTVFIFSMVLILLTNFILYSYNAYDYIFQQAKAIRESQRGSKVMIKEIREARTGEDGSYLIETAENFELIFYSDIDYDLKVEKVRYYVHDTDLIKEVFEPQNFPPVYSSEPKQYYISSWIRNSLPVFRYFDGNGQELASPARKKDTKVVQVYLEININPLRPPSDFILEDSVQIRNLKEF